jgi:hypothetical protein
MLRPHDRAGLQPIAPSLAISQGINISKQNATAPTVNILMFIHRTSVEGGYAELMWSRHATLAGQFYALDGRYLVDLRG